MSQGINKYIPLDFDPAKHGSVNAYRGTHALGQRARKIDQGILTVRFEMPFNARCTGCDEHIARGVRFNAEKSRVGDFHSTAVHAFVMKCPRCKQRLVLQTDPAESDFRCTEGCRRKMEQYEFDEDDRVVTLMSETDRAALASDPIARLEHGETDASRAQKQYHPVLERLKDVRDVVSYNDYEVNQAARRVLREQKGAAAEDGRKARLVLGSALDWHTQDPKRKRRYYEDDDSHVLELAHLSEEERTRVAASSSRFVRGGSARTKQAASRHGASIFGARPTASHLVVAKHKGLLGTAPLVGPQAMPSVRLVAATAAPERDTQAPRKKYKQDASPAPAESALSAIAGYADDDEDTRP